MFSERFHLSLQDSASDIRFENDISPSTDQTADADCLVFKNVESLFHDFTFESSPTISPDDEDSNPIGGDTRICPIVRFRSQNSQAVVPATTLDPFEDHVNIPSKASSLYNLVGQFSKFRFLPIKRYRMCTYQTLTDRNRKRKNQKPVVGNNKKGRKGKLRCEACRQRKRGVTLCVPIVY